MALKVACITIGAMMDPDFSYTHASANPITNKGNMIVRELCTRAKSAALANMPASG
ncbi:uncharacterized protein METZ01_LOCUS406244, partial [marine metagenome]